MTSLWLDLDGVVDVAAAMLAAKHDGFRDEELRVQTDHAVRHVLRRLNALDLPLLTNGPFLAHRDPRTETLGLYVAAGHNQRTPGSSTSRYRGWEP